MERSAEPQLSFTVLNFQNLLRLVAIFDVDLAPYGRIHDVVYARKDPSQPGHIKLVPLAFARESVDGDFVPGSGRLPFNLEPPFVQRLADEAERILEKDRAFLRDNGLDALSDVVLPSQRDLEVDWNGN